MKKHVTKYYVLLLLATMFAAPGVTAYLFYQHPTWLGSSKINKGTLLSPPISLSHFGSKTKWRLLLISPDGCKKDCLEQLNMLARVRLALGRKLYQVDEWLVLDDKSSVLADEIKPLLKDQDINVTTLNTADLAKLSALPADAKVFIANPDNFLILSYQTGGNPDDIYKDLKLLLSTTEQKSN
ncbi:hypothetical protein [Legionella bononiensis]|uniref:Uncharacterized protein n=1 Tax=Legionella bononiensis TaxID=2793102 RepID=A0ABS1W978_9GAMM|nr:hypothetical protein [Legionella bononiensis]MBL7480908.1 hypothetical protein [Legionella bononiensis]MBL7525910.1 hypothetical protein [Legionella bononiensis]MBL7564023.1 hypothetical protein [Legionella bononiensis]